MRLFRCLLTASLLASTIAFAQDAPNTTSNPPNTTNPRRDGISSAANSSGGPLLLSCLAPYRDRDVAQHLGQDVVADPSAHGGVGGDDDTVGEHRDRERLDVVGHHEVASL